MDDKNIVDLYWQRSEKAIVETDSKYGGYCFSIAYNVLANKEDAEESVSDTYMERGTSSRPIALRSLQHSLVKSPAIFPSAAGEPAVHISGVVVKWSLLWKNWMHVSQISRMWNPTISGRKPLLCSTAFWIPFRKQSAGSSCADTGAWIPSQILQQISDSPRARSRLCCTGREPGSGRSSKRRALYEFQRFA